MIGRSLILSGAMATRRLTLCSVAFAIAALPAMAVAQTSRVSLVLDERGVTLDARDATLREVLSEWERVGGIKLLNAEVLDERRVTLQVSAVGEREALDILLRDLGGYVLGLRGANASGRSQFGTLVLAANKGPATRPPSPALPPLAAFAPQDETNAPSAVPVFGLRPAPSSAVTKTAPGSRFAAARNTQDEPEEELVEGAHAATLAPRELRPPTPYQPSVTTPDASRPVGGVGSAMPGTITSPPPGAFAPTVDPRAQPGSTQP